MILTATKSMTRTTAATAIGRLGFLLATVAASCLATTAAAFAPTLSRRLPIPPSAVSAGAQLRPSFLLLAAEPADDDGSVVVVPASIPSSEAIREAAGVVRTFGSLVDWELGENIEGGYACPCCTYPNFEEFGLNDVSNGLDDVSIGGESESADKRPGRDKARLTEERGPRIGIDDGDDDDDDAARLLRRQNALRPSTLLAAPLDPAPDPSWLAERSAKYDALKRDRDAELAAMPRVPIEVRLPDGTVLSRRKNDDADDDGPGPLLLSWESTPLDVARIVSDGLANVAVVARVLYSSRVGTETGGPRVATFEIGDDDNTSTNPVAENEEKAELWDLTRPLEGNCTIEILTFDGDLSGDAKAVFWHSSAHMLGQALEHTKSALLTVGPPVEGGFYYDAYLGDGAGISESQFEPLEDEFRRSVKRKEAFERLEMTKSDALDLFDYSPFKTALVESKVPDGTLATVYRNGDLIDLCPGPHVPHTGKIKAFKMLRASASQWLGETDGDRLQRVYGVSFPKKKMLKEHVENLEKAKERDHRRLGVKQKLFMFHELSPGSAFFLPRGTVIYNALTEFIKKQYRFRGYNEVITPNIYNLKLWQKSGHAKHYKDDMFTFDVEGEEFGMKPMNCPGHCLLFDSEPRSYRDLPLRIADFGVLHRNEKSGALGGLTRVRRFQQDDAHVFCTEDQIASEVMGCLDFVKFAYDTFGMSYRLELSTRPAKAMGDEGLWNRAEASLSRAMDEFAGVGGWTVNPGDGAFYGPKIDVKVFDALGRVHQCATVQLDFQLPRRFGLRYRKKGGSGVEIEVGEGEGDGEQAADSSATDDDDVDVENKLPPDFERPVMIHRAMLGSVERIFAVLLEHYGGKWPFWLSPRQALVVPVGMDFVDYGVDVRDRLRAAGFHVDIDDSSKSLKKKVREGQLAQYNYILVVGERERDNDSVSVRNRSNEQEGEKTVDDVLNQFQDLCDTYQL